MISLCRTGPINMQARVFGPSGAVDPRWELQADLSDQLHTFLQDNDWLVRWLRGRSVGARRSRHFSPVQINCTLVFSFDHAAFVISCTAAYTRFAVAMQSMMYLHSIRLLSWHWHLCRSLRRTEATSHSDYGVAAQCEGAGRPTRRRKVQPQSRAPPPKRPAAQMGDLTLAPGWR